MKRIVLIASAIALLAAAAPAGAQIVQPLGAASFAVSCSGAQGSITTGSGCSAGNSSAFVNFGPIPFAQAEATYPGDLALVPSSASAGMTYQFMIIGGGPGITVPLNIFFFLEASGSGANSYAFASARITTGLGVVSQTICTFGCGVGDGVGRLQGTLTTFGVTNQTGFVDLSTVAANGLSFSPLSAHALADPYIYVDPSFPDAARYSIIVSPGVGNGPGAGAGVPEQATWALIVVGFGLIGDALRRRQTPKAAYATTSGARTSPHRPLGV